MPTRTYNRLANWAGYLLMSGMFVGCSASEKTLGYLGERDLRHYKDSVTAIEYPAINEETPDEVSYTDEPRRIRNPRKDTVWNMSLEEALHTSLASSEIIRDGSQFLSPGNRLLSNPDFVTSVYDPALQDTNPLFGQNGVEAALSEFDATFTTNMLWGRSENISETTGFNGIAPGDTITTESGDFRSALSKIFADGTQFSMSHNVLYQNFNQGSGAGANRIFPSFFTNNPSATQNGGLAGLEFDLRRPMWSGSGTQFTRTAGPISRRPTLQNVPQVNQGVVISRIRTDIALAEFEQSIVGLSKDVEDTYWDLYLAYRRYDADVTARNSSLKTWRFVKNKLGEGIGEGGAADEAQAREGYFESRGKAEESLANLYGTECRLRRILGLPVNDGRIIRPSDEPSTAEFLPDWRSSLVEALCKRIELRKQKWNIHSLDLQLEAAKSLTKPRLDFVSRYQINGLGDRLLGDSDAPGTRVPNSFYGNLLDGNQTGWGLGWEFSMPLGFRAAHSQVRNLELKLAKARAALGAQEHEISHELANAVRQLDASFQTAQTNFNRRRAAERRLQAYEAQYQTGKANVDSLLRSQISLAQAETAYYQSLVSYNKSITELKFRKGTLLEDDRIFLSESLSHPESYAQALRRAWARSYGINAAHLKTEPPEFVSDSTDPVEIGTGPYRVVEPTGLTPESLPNRSTPAAPPASNYEEPMPDNGPLPKSQPTPKPNGDPIQPKPMQKPGEPVARRTESSDDLQAVSADDKSSESDAPKIQQLDFVQPKSKKFLELDD